TREKMSRPSSSVPNQCAALGGCKREGRSTLLGLCGAIHGANNAKITNTATNITPAVASALRRPSDVTVLQVVAFSIVPSEARDPYRLRILKLLKASAKVPPHRCRLVL